MGANDRFVGVQVSPISFIDEGVEPVLDFLKESTTANTIFVAAHGYNPEVIDRPEYHPGHGKGGSHGNPGGTFVATHREYYGGIPVGDSRASGDPLGEFDVLAATIPAAHARDMSVYVYILEGAITGGRETEVAGFPRLLEVDLHGRRGPLGCINHPAYRDWQLALVEDIYKTYAIDGFKWGVERWGPLHQTLMGDPPACFCTHCGAVAREHGVDQQRMLAGYRTLWESVRGWQSAAYSTESSPAIDLIQILSAYPEILAWEHLWTERYLSLHREIYGMAKWLAPDRPFGLGLWHYYFINPLLRAEWRLREFTASMDFISPILYRWPEGSRVASFLGTLTAGPGTGFTAAELFSGFTKILGLELGSLDDVVAGGLPADYVSQGISIVRRLVGPIMPIYPGIGIDVVQEGIPREMEPGDVEEDIRSAYRAGADGLVIARNYAEMRVENVKAAGVALRGLEHGGLGWGPSVAPG